jgi:hypothetical protein
MKENTQEIVSPQDELEIIRRYYIKIQEKIWSALDTHNEILKINERKPNYETTRQIANVLFDLSSKNTEYQEISQEFLIQIEKLRKRELEILNKLN